MRTRLNRSMLMSACLAVASAAILVSAPPAIMPARRPELEAGFDLNDTLADKGKRDERKGRKAERKQRMQDLQRAAVSGQ